MRKKGQTGSWAVGKLLDHEAAAGLAGVHFEWS